MDLGSPLDRSETLPEGVERKTLLGKMCIVFTEGGPVLDLVPRETTMR